MKTIRPIDTRSHWITPKEAAEALNVSRATIYRLCHENKVRYYKVNKLFRLDPEFLTLWLSSTVNTK